MSSTRFVGKAKELKSALNDKADSIVITDRKLALAVRVIKSVTYTKLALIAGGAGVAAASFWNPVGLFLVVLPEPAVWWPSELLRVR